MANPSERKFFKNVVTLVVLSPDDDIKGATLSTIAYEIENGDWSGGELKIESTQVSGPEMALLLEDQGSDPEFFNLDENGNDVDD